MILYADTSAIARAYLPDEPERREIRALLFDGAAVVSSELTRVEFASAMHAAVRARRLRRPDELLDRFDADCGPDGRLRLLQLDPAATVPLARSLVIDHPLRTLDAIHLAVALTAARQIDPDVTVLTRDARQAEAAVALGLPVR